MEAEENHDEDEWDDEAKDEMAQDDACATETVETKDSGDIGEAGVKKEEKPESGKDTTNVVDKGGEKPEAPKIQKIPENVEKELAKPIVPRKLFPDEVSPDAPPILDDEKQEPPKQTLWNEINGEVPPGEEVPKKTSAPQEAPQKEDEVQGQEVTASTLVVLILLFLIGVTLRTFYLDSLQVTTIHIKK